jgi:hypothetical protein
MHGLVTGDRTSRSLPAMLTRRPDMPSLHNHREWRRLARIRHTCCIIVSPRPIALAGGDTRCSRQRRTAHADHGDWCWEPSILQRFARNWKTNDRFRSGCSIGFAPSPDSCGYGTDATAGFRGARLASARAIRPNPRVTVQFGVGFSSNTPRRPSRPTTQWPRRSSSLWARPVGYAVVTILQVGRVLEADAFSASVRGHRQPNRRCRIQNCILTR